MKHFAIVIFLLLAGSLTLSNCGNGRTGPKYQGPEDKAYRLIVGQTITVQSVDSEEESFVVTGDWYVISGKKLQEIVEKGLELKVHE